MGAELQGLVCWRELEKAERRMPIIAPRVPPMSSTAAVVALKSDRIEPFLAAPSSKSVVMAVSVSMDS